MAGPLDFDALTHAFHRVLDHLPDSRRGKNISSAVKDAALGAFAVFFTQSSSFLAHQQALRQAKGTSNAHSSQCLLAPFLKMRYPCPKGTRPA